MLIEEVKCLNLADYVRIEALCSKVIGVHTTRYILYNDTMNLSPNFRMIRMVEESMRVLCDVD